MENWVNFAEFDQTHYVDTEYALQGSGSLRVESIRDNTEATIYSPSLETQNNNAASEGRVKTAIRRTSRVYIGMYVRFVDIDNHYFIVGGQFDDLRGLRLYKREDGQTQLINSVEFETFSDRTEIYDEPNWIPFRITWHEDDLNGFRIWVQEDANEDGEWSDVGGDVVDPDPSFGPNESTTGSGIGFGSNSAAVGPDADDDLSSLENGLWFDRTQLYYDTNA
ncbi:hypothetical protein [Halorubrum kocurii]|uniref:hypothetical protein n=1 Tax=Halorubrum kocurii TaxID=478441 RepID=UPI001268150B|nr:hypothetical protein [Halorubrum kocurii]